MLRPFGQCRMEQDGAERSSPAEAGFGCLCFMALKCGKEATLAEGNPLPVVKNSRCARDEERCSA